MKHEFRASVISNVELNCAIVFELFIWFSFTELEVGSDATGGLSRSKENGGADVIQRTSAVFTRE